MIRRCNERDFDEILTIVNDAARAYKGAIPADRWREPYMPAQELRMELEAGVDFYGCEAGGRLLGVMGIQPVQDVQLIRHAYVRTAERRRGFGSRLIRHIREGAQRPMLVGTWAAADWAIRFYEKHGFELAPAAETSILLRRYWNIPDRQIETSVVLAESGWLAKGRGSHDA